MIHLCCRVEPLFQLLVLTFNFRLRLVKLSLLLIAFLLKNTYFILQLVGEFLSIRSIADLEL